MGPILVLLITLLAIASGALLVAGARLELDSWRTLAAGTAVGLALLAWLAFLSALVFGLGTLSILLTCALLAAAPLAINRYTPLAPAIERARTELGQFNSGQLLYYSFWGLLLAALFSRVVIFEGGSFLTAPLNNYGDLPFHLSVISSFAWGENLPPQNPIFAGYRFTYPFLIDFLTAFNLAAGAGWRVAFFISNIALALALVAIVEFWAREITGSRMAGRIAPFLLLFNGGFGFINFLKEAGNAPDLGALLASLPHTYTMIDPSQGGLSTPFGVVPLRWGNLFTTLIIPQRSLLFGLPFVALILAFWWMGLREASGEGSSEQDAKRLRQRYFAAAGVLAGLLPLLHAHGFFSVMIVSPLLVVLFRTRDWAWFFAPALALSVPQALYLSSTPVRGELFKLHFGWESGESSIVLFWLVNAGVFIALLVAAFAWRGMLSERARRYSLAFLLWFAVPNLVLLAPWSWDNIKVLVYWALASAPLVAAALAALWRRGIIWRLGAALLFIMLVFSGALDVLRALSGVEKAAIFSPAEREMAELIRAGTEPHSVILHAPIHNSVNCLAGRRSLMGYPGHLWTHGINSAEREGDVKAIYRAEPNAEELIARYGIDYLLVGPAERAQLSPAESQFATRYETVIDHAGYKLYRVRK